MAKVGIDSMKYNKTLRAFTTTLTDGSIGPTVSVDAIIAKEAELVHVKEGTENITRDKQVVNTAFLSIKDETAKLQKKYAELIADINAILDRIETKVGV